jgi:hypothetical protein
MGDKCALRTCAVAYRRQYHAARIGMIPYVFSEYLHDVFSGHPRLTPFDYFEYFAEVLLAPEQRRMPRRIPRSTILHSTPVALQHFASHAEWQRFHFERKPEYQKCDTIYRLPFMYRIGSAARYRSLKALVY